jgi:hypothetical protein
VVAQVELHAGELFPRVGFIVANLETAGRVMTKRLFGAMVRRIAALPLPAG